MFLVPQRLRLSCCATMQITYTYKHVCFQTLSSKVSWLEAIVKGLSPVSNTCIITQIIHINHFNFNTPYKTLNTNPAPSTAYHKARISAPAAGPRSVPRRSCGQLRRHVTSLSGDVTRSPAGTMQWLPVQVARGPARRAPPLSGEIRAASPVRSGACPGAPRYRLSQRPRGTPDRRDGCHRCCAAHGPAPLTLLAAGLVCLTSWCSERTA